MILSSLLILAVLATALIIALSALSVVKHGQIKELLNDSRKYIRIVESEYNRLADLPSGSGLPTSLSRYCEAADRCGSHTYIDSEGVHRCSWCAGEMEIPR